MDSHIIKILDQHFLPYQKRWILDESMTKLWEKTRRGGMTYGQSFEDSYDAVKEKWPAIWFTSADETAAKEYILYCQKFAKVLNVLAEYVGEVVIDEIKGFKALQVKFENGVRINALTSNPTAFRSKGGKAIWDEAAWHKNDLEMWKAMKPITTWGFPVRILSTHNGKQKLFFKFIDAIKKGKLKWSHHYTDIFLAVEEGLYDKIKGRPTTEEERKEWLKELEQDCFDRTTWLEEYCCIPVDEATSFIPYDLYDSCSADDVLLSTLRHITGNMYVGVDVGRRKDLTVIWIAEKLGDVLYTRMVIELEKTRFKIQKDYLFEIFSHPKFRRGCMDATGLGMQLAEECQERFGQYRIEPITFSGTVKEDIAYKLRGKMEDRKFIVPEDLVTREDFHSIRKVTTAANNIRFDVAQSEVSGHADRFWGAALCNYAVSEDNGPVIVKSSNQAQSIITRIPGYYDLPGLGNY